MIKINSADDYYQLIHQRKQQLGMLKTNALLTREDLERYVGLGRLYYENVSKGIVFYSDEDKYYQLYFYLTSDGGLDVGKKEKPVVLKYIYKEGCSDFYKSLYQHIMQNGFVYKDTLRHLVLDDMNGLVKKLEKTIPAIERQFARFGFRYRDAEEHDLNAIYDLLDSLEQLPYYQIPFFTKEEYLSESKEGRLSCIVDDDGHLLAARHLILNGRKAYGWIGINKEYRGLYGFTPYILYRQLLYMRDNGITMCSWVSDTNVDSIQYHDRIGSVFTGHMQDEYVMGE